MITGTWDVEFTKEGRVFDNTQVTDLVAGLDGATDLLVLSHGWNNDRAEAGHLYSTLLGSLRQVGLPASGPGSRVAVMQVLWPSKKFALSSLIPGGGAASAVEAGDQALRESLEELKRDPDRLGENAQDPVRATAVDRALETLAELDDSADARREYVHQIRLLLDPTQAHEDDGSVEFLTMDPEDLFDQFTQEVPVTLAAGAGGAASLGEGGAVFLGDLLSGVKAAARRIANFATYYTMKTRAGVVGQTGVATVLLRATDQHPDLRIHLAGHSFGGRLVTAAAAGVPHRDSRLSLVLLQAAFSHNGLARRFDGTHDGAFRTLLADKRVTGPVVITHTKNDLAVGVAYPLASRIAGDKAAAIGDENDPYGGMGRNGAQHTPEVSPAVAELRAASQNTRYAFVPGSVFNLRADSTITGHGDVTNTAVATALRDVLTLP